MNLKEKCIKKNVLYTGKAVNFCLDDVKLPNGNTAQREYLEHPGAVAILPFLNKDTIMLINQYRYPAGEAIWEIPAGKLGKDEGTLACAHRELEEETGYKAKTVEYLRSFFPTPAYSTEQIHIFVATDMVPVMTMPDEDEIFRRKAVAYRDALEMVRSGSIKDALSIIAILSWSTRERTK